ncbi:hypothetical protein ABH927_006602 [Planotetraspora sp. GP83]
MSTLLRLLAGVDEPESGTSVEVAFMLNLSPEEVPWESHPAGTGWLSIRCPPARGHDCAGRP